MTSVAEQPPLRRLSMRISPDKNMRRENRQRWKFFLEAWANYSEKLNIKAQPPDVQITTFLSCVGSEGERLFNEMKFDTSEDKQDLNKIVSKFSQHFGQNSDDKLGMPVENSRLKARYRFHTRVQQQGETMDNFVCGVKKLVKDCHFCSCAVDGLVRDQVLFGMADEGIRQRLLQEEDISLKILREICQMSDLMRKPSDSSPCSESVLGVAANALPISPSVISVSKCVALDYTYSTTSIHSAAPLVLQRIPLDAGCLADAPSMSQQVLDLSRVASSCRSSMPVSSRNEDSSHLIRVVPPHPEHMQQSAPGSGSNQQNFILPSASNESVRQLPVADLLPASTTSSAVLHAESMPLSAANSSHVLRQAMFTCSKGLQQVDADHVNEKFEQAMRHSSQSMGQTCLEVTRNLRPALPDGRELLYETSLQKHQHLKQATLGSSQGLQQGEVLKRESSRGSSGLQQALTLGSRGLLQVASVGSQVMQQPPLQSSTSLQQDVAGSSQALLLGQDLQAATESGQDDEGVEMSVLREVDDEPTSKDSAENDMCAEDSVEDYSTWPACEVCGKKFRTVKKVNRHKFIHRQKYKCSVCLQELPGFKQYQKHQTLHAEAQPDNLSLATEDHKEQARDEERVAVQVDISVSQPDIPFIKEEIVCQPVPTTLSGSDGSSVADKGHPSHHSFADLPSLQTHIAGHSDPASHDSAGHADPAGHIDPAGHVDPASPVNLASHADPTASASSVRHAGGTPQFELQDIILPRKRLADTGSKEDQGSSSTSVLVRKKKSRKTGEGQHQGSASTKTTMEREDHTQREASRKRKLTPVEEEVIPKEKTIKKSRESTCKNDMYPGKQTPVSASAATLESKTVGREGNSKRAKIRNRIGTSPQTVSFPNAEAEAGDCDESVHGDVDTDGDSDDHHDSDVEEINSSSSQDRKRKLGKPQRLYECADCGKVYRESRNLRIHRSANCLGGQGNPHCRHCGRVYTSLKRLQNHMVSHHPDALGTGAKDSDSSDQTESCSVRKYSDFNRSVGQKDLKISDVDEGPMFPCEQCPKVFRNSWSRQYHIQQIHDRLFNCSKCGEISRGKDNHQAHLRTHVKTKVGMKSRVSVCRECGKVCGSYYHLKKHMASVHLGETTPCDVCGKRFVDKNYLNYHKVIHTGEMPFWCHLCNKGFKLSQGYKYHMRKHDGTSPYTCEYCGASFYQMSHLKYHIRVHTNERPHACLECGKTFPTNSSLKRHAFVHTEERNSICELCGRGYKCEKYLQVHMKTHEKEAKNAAL